MKHLILFLIIIVGFIIIKYINLESFTNTKYILPSVEVRYSDKIKGRGVFALKNYKKGDLIEICPCINDDFKNFNGLMKDYLFKYDETKSLVAFGYCSLYNHSDDYNALWTVLSDKELKIYATKDINTGDEIFVSYGDTYWTSRQDKKY